MPFDGLGVEGRGAAWVEGGAYGDEDVFDRAARLLAGAQLDACRDPSN